MEKPAKHGKFLQLIRSQGLHIECRDCGHGKTVLVSDLIEQVGPDAAVGDVLARAKCSKCGSRRIAEAQIVSPAIESMQAAKDDEKAAARAAKKARARRRFGHN